MRTIFDIMEALAEICARDQIVEPRLVLEFTHDSDKYRFERQMMKDSREAMRAGSIDLKFHPARIKHMNIRIILSTRPGE